MAKTNPPPGGGHSLHPGYLRRRGDPRRGGIEGGGVNRSCIGVRPELHHVVSLHRNQFANDFVRSLTRKRHRHRCLPSR